MAEPDSRPPVLKITTRAMIVASLVVVGGCADDGLRDPEPQGRIEDAVTGAAASALSDGHFRIDVPGLRYGTLSSIDSTQARDYATRYLAQFWDGQPTGLKELWSASHGTPLQLDGLVPCGPMRLAVSAAYAPVDELPVGSRRVTAEYWLVRFCEGGQTAGFVGVSPYATDIAVVDDLLTWPPLGGGQFQNDGLPADFEETARFSPETAAIMGRQCTGQRIRSVPRLILQYGQRGYMAKWELVLERQASFRVSNGVASADTIYAGFTFIGGASGQVHQGLALASVRQPSEILLTIIDNIPPASEPVPPNWTPHFKDIAISRDPGIPILFDSIPAASCPTAP